MKIERLFNELKTKEIICWGSGKHFKNITYPFLCKSGLIERLGGFLDTTGSGKVVLDGRQYDRIKKSDLYSKNAENLVILIAVTGYREIQSQLSADPYFSSITAIPSIYLESLYEDLMMLSVIKPEPNYRKNSKPVIPKIIHTFWFSKEELPSKYRECLKSWKKYASDFEIKIWNLDSYKPEKCLFFEQAIEDKNWAFASDYARVDVLRRYGGVYMDLDVEMLRPIYDLIYNDAYMSFESLTRIECGSGMGAKAGNKIIDEICKSYENRPYYKADGSWDNSTCPVRYTEIIEKHGLKKDGCFQFVEDITIYPFEVLTGKSFDTGIIYKTDLSYTTHHHNGSWIPKGAKNAMENRYKEIEGFIYK
ncbi:MAG: glycosyltransferase [Lachnospiraceae bacterium]|nr:glycosyltransferase [Lachnospiraceae bacterium]